MYIYILQKQAAPALDEVVAAKRGAQKPVQKKVTVKPKPEEVIDISSTEEVNNTKHKKKEGEANSKKKTHTLTAVLTARSKVG